MRLVKIRISTRTYVCGDERDRTVGLLSAIQALSQLSYIPITTGRVNADRGVILRSAIDFATGVF